jgi:hypothetical protein
MRFNDPARPKLANGRVCWVDSLIVLPTFELSPRGACGEWNIRLMCGGIWAEKKIQIDDVMGLLAAWDEDPEEFMRVEFGREPPKGLGPNGRYALVEKMERAAFQASAKTAEELGF